MSGAGSATVAWAAEQSYLGGVSGTPTYRNPGTNVQVQTGELNRNLLRLVLPGDVESDDYLAQQIEGQLAVQFVMTDDEFHRLVFNDSFTGFTSGTVNSAEWYLGVDHLNGTTERQIKGWVPATAEISYSGATEAVTVTLTGPYGAEEQNTSITPGTITGRSTGSEVPGHGAALDIDGTRVTKLQSATQSIQGISRLIRDSNDPKPVTAVAGNVQTDIQLSAVYDGSDLYDLALGSSGATTIEDDVDSVPGSVAFEDSAGNSVADYSYSTVAPETYGWSDLVSNDADLTETVTFFASGVTASDPTT